MWRTIVTLLSVAYATSAYGSLTVLIGEPFGSFGTLMPAGHTAVYLNEVCADGPLKLRSCLAGESKGVVLARYHAIGPYDWMATPVMYFLYAVEGREDIPEFATPEAVWQLRERYRQNFLSAIVPDGEQGAESGNGRSLGAGAVEEWWESAGMAYNRRLWAYEVATTAEQDLDLIHRMNADENRHHYHLKGANCADFAAGIVNFYLPGAVHRNGLADLELLTPKQVAHSLVSYNFRHPEAQLRVQEIPQVPGSLRRSRPIRGGAESLLKTKRYLFALLALQPEIPPVLLLMYLWHDRWQVGGRRAEKHSLAFVTLH